MIFRQLFDKNSSTYSYLITSKKGGEALIIEAKIQLKDISRIRVHDDVRIRFTAYDSSKFGHVLGRVSRISPDAVIDKGSDVATHYLIKNSKIKTLIVIK